MGSQGHRQAWPDTGEVTQPYAVFQFRLQREVWEKLSATFHKLGAGPIAPQNVRASWKRLKKDCSKFNSELKLRIALKLRIFLTGSSGNGLT